MLGGLELDGTKEGRKGKLGMTVEVSEMVAVVEFTVLRDTFEYVKLCEEVRPALKDIVRSWQGDANPPSISQGRETLILCIEEEQ
ncbi:hypothetical protein K1719_008658 [Acacia pycnantha]|nr:hypothetical protein K1719_008658 [Acacia pycnantha]